MQGWVKLYRSLLDDPVWQLSTPNQKSVLITILLLASHKEKEWEWNGEKYQIVPGQFITSTESLSQKSGKGITRQVVRGSLQRFEKMNFITSKSTKVSTLITVVNWGKYQDESENTTNDSTKRQPTDNQETTTIKNVRSKEVSNRPSGDGQKPTLKSNFELLWKLYPRKEEKKRAFDAYKKAVKDGTTNKEIQDGIIAYSKQIRLESTPRQFIKQGGTWFFNNSWEDEYETAEFVKKPEPTVDEDTSQKLKAQQADEATKKYLAAHPELQE